MNFADLFPDDDYRFHMALRRGLASEFFGRSPAHAALTGERKRWLKEDSRSYAACLPEGEPLLEECTALMRESGAITDNDQAKLRALKSLEERCIALGELVEPDFLLLKSDGGATHHLLSGGICFPSSWSLAEKIGKPLDVVHSVVPSATRPYWL